MTVQNFEDFLKGNFYPVLFDYWDCERTCAVSGTLFLVSYKKKCFAVTTRHCFINNQHQPARIRIYPRGHEHNLALPLVSMHTPNGSFNFSKKSKYSDCEDLVIIHIASEILTPDTLSRLSFINLDTYSMPSEEKLQSSDIHIYGCPSELNAPDYDKMIIYDRLISVHASYSGETVDEHISELKTLNSSIPIKSLDGMSGSPIFSFAKGEAFFLGMLIRGGSVGSDARYIDSQFIVDEIARFHPKTSPQFKVEIETKCTLISRHDRKKKK